MNSPAKEVPAPKSTVAAHTPLLVSAPPPEVVASFLSICASLFVLDRLRGALEDGTAVVNDQRRFRLAQTLIAQAEHEMDAATRPQRSPSTPGAQRSS
jgi:hypothetical protein